MEMPRESVIKKRIDTEKNEESQYAPHDRGRGSRRGTTDGQRSRGRRGRGRGRGGGGRGGGQVLPVARGRGKKPDQRGRGRGRGGGYMGIRDFSNLDTDPALRVHQREETETWVASGVASTLGEDNGSFKTEEERKQQREARGPYEGSAGHQIGLGRHLLQEAAEGADGRVEQRGLQSGGGVSQHGAGGGLQFYMQ